MLPKVGEDPNPLSKSRLNLSRLRTAWQTAQGMVQKKQKRQMEGSVEDSEEPIDDSTRLDLLAQFKILHDITPTMMRQCYWMLSTASLCNHMVR